MPKVSIVIPIYNQEKYLRQSLDSVIKQTLSDIEIICVNDGSTDGSRAILEEYVEKDKRIKILNQENQGAGIARNNGIEIATGEYLMFLDPDDWYDLTICEKAYNQIKQNNNDLVMFNFLMFIEKTGKYSSGDWRLAPLKKYFNQSNINLKELKNYIISAYTVTQIYSLEFIKDNNIKFSDNKFVEDVPFYIKAIVSAKDVSIIDEPLYFYRIQNKSSSQTFYDNWKDLLDVRYKCLDFINNRNDKEYYIYPFLIYAIDSLIFWYGKAENDRYRNIKSFYGKVRNFFKMIHKNYDVENIKKYTKNYKIFKKICKLPYILYIAPQILKIIFSVVNIKNHKVITILGIKFKFKRTNKLLKYKKEPIKKNRIVFNNFNGNGYGCNPKYIAEEIIKQKLPYELAWIVKHEHFESIPKYIKAIDYNSGEAFRYISTAKCIISNCRLNHYINLNFEKKEKQLYIQTWHGCLAFKKIEKDIEHNDFYKNYLDVAKIDSNYIDYLVSPSQFDTQILKNCFYYNGEYLEVGYPRNDLFFFSQEEQNKIVKKVYSKLNIESNKSLVLYSPTFRDNFDIETFRLDGSRLIETLNKKYNKDFILLVRLHPNIGHKSKEFSTIFKNAINVTNYDDLQELLIASDIFITDYSSCIFDFCLSNKPAFVFAKDIEQYELERGFYISLDTMPFPIAQTEEELFYNISNLDENKYKTELEKFLNKRGSFDNGNASKNIVEIIKKRIKE